MDAVRRNKQLEHLKSIVPNTGWHWIGRLGVGTCFILLSFYSVVGGWVLIYLFRGITGQLITPGQNYGTLFTETIGNPAWAIMGHFAFMFITIWVVSKGVQNGIEKASKYMLPALFVLFVALIIRSLTLDDDAMKGVKFFLQPDFSRLLRKVFCSQWGNHSLQLVSDFNYGYV